MNKIFLFIFLLLFLMNHNLMAKDHKLLMVYVEMEHCPWCHKMDKEIFKNKKVLSDLEKLYIISKITRESNNIPSFFKPKYYPTTYILSADGMTLLDELPGYMPVDQYLDYLITLHEIEK